MSSLSAHLRQTEDHSRLRFHPGCPVCHHDRLAGSLSGDELVSRRVQAAVAAGLLAFSTSGVSVALASEPDEVSDGTSEVVTPSDPSANADFEPGGETNQLPDASPATPEVVQPPAGVSDDVGVVEQEPARDPTETAVTEVPVVAPEAPTVTETPPPAAPGVVAPPAAESPTVSTTSEEGEIRADTSKRRTVRRERPAKSTIEATRVVPQPAPAPAPAAAPAPTPAPAPVATRVVAGTSTSAGRAAPGDRVHVVSRGESLWSIAGDVLGDRASVARIAREVNRLWALNEDSITSGDPNLLFAGTRLRLR